MIISHSDHHLNIYIIIRPISVQPRRPEKHLHPLATLTWRESAQFLFQKKSNFFLSLGPDDSSISCFHKIIIQFYPGLVPTTYHEPPLASSNMRHFNSISPIETPCDDPNAVATDFSALTAR